MRREVIATDKVAQTGFPYCQAIRYGDLVFVAGQVAIDPATGKLVDGDIGVQTRRVLDNVAAILQAAGTSLEYSLDLLCFLADIADFPSFNQVYRTYFPEDGPPRTTVQAILPLGARVEIRIIAALPEGIEVGRKTSRPTG